MGANYRAWGAGNAYCSSDGQPKEDANISEVESALGSSLAHVTAQLAPAGSWRDASHGEHFAQFFETDDALIEAVCEFGAHGLASCEIVILIATAPHLVEIEGRWRDRGVDVQTAKSLDQYVPIDADALLERLLLDDWPRARRFAEHVETLVASAVRRSPRVRAFGEMVGALWAQGRYAAAIHLEELWNQLARRYEFTLFCGYPMTPGVAVAPDALRRVCSEHSRAVPAESYTALASPIERLAEICDLQNRARCVEHELHERKSAQRLLARREQELQEKVRQLAEIDQRKDDYLAMLGHELRNPLAAIRNAAAALSRGTDADATRQALCEVLNRQVSHMGRLLDDLLDVNRITHGKIVLRREPCDLATIVERAVETSRPLIEERCHRLDVHLPQEAVRFDGDSLRLTQVLGNLLHNSAKYTPPGGRITIHASTSGNWLRLTVADTGIGISAEMLPRIFEPFVQADQALERAQGGLGIGLTLVRGIVELHGGTAQASSEGLGLGTEVTLRLPLERTDLGAALAADARENALCPHKRVLIVDDNRDAADSLALLLTLAGHEVRSLGDGCAAVDAARAFSPDLILMDIGLPGLDGYAAARRLREIGCLARLAAVTGYGRPEDRQRAQEAGFDDFFVKPIDPRELERLLT